MTYRFIMRFLLTLLCCNLALPLCFGQTDSSSAAQKPASNELSDKPIQIPHITPAPADGKIAFVAAKLLEGGHYTKQTFDESVSSKFLDRYLEALDPQHMDFIQPDLAEFEHYRTNLGHLTLNRRDTRPACEIFNRFMERLVQRTA